MHTELDEWVDPSHDPHSFAARLRVVLTESGTPIRQLFPSGSRPSRSQVMKYLTGAHRPTIDTAVLIAARLGICVHHLLSAGRAGQVCSHCFFKEP